MRIPWSKPYRAFQAFNGMTDEECDRYLRSLRMQGRMPRWLPWLLAGVVAVASLLVSPILVSTMTAISPKGRITSLDRIEVFPQPGPLLFTAADALIAVIWVVLWVGLPMVAGLLTRDAQLLRVLKARDDGGVHGE